MATKVYGVSDDLIEVEGDVFGEVCEYGTDKDTRGVMLRFSDGTLLETKYGKGGRGIWGINLVTRGSLFERIDPCSDENAVPYSDVARFSVGLTWAEYRDGEKWKVVS